MNRIRFYREKAGLSIRQLAKRAGVHRNYLGQVESGYYPASTKFLARIAKELGVAIKDLIGKE